MSEEHSPFFEPDFNRAVKIRIRDPRLSSNGGALLLREIDHRLGLVESLSSRLVDRRNQDRIRYELTELIRERVFALALGCIAVDDADVLAHDPCLRIATWNRPGEHVVDERLASQPTQSRLTDAFADCEENFRALQEAPCRWLERHLRGSGRDRRVRRATLDVDGLPLVAYGSQEGALYNGYYREKVYHPLIAGFAPEGDYDSARLGDGFLAAKLREGNVRSCDGAVDFIRDAVRRGRDLGCSIDVRFDAGFAEGEIMDALSDDGTRFVGRIKNNAVLDAMARPYLKRPVGRPPKEGYQKIVELFWYQAEGWKHAQRVVLVVIDGPDSKTGQLELFPRYFFLVTNFSYAEMDAGALLEHYRKRGTFEDRIGEFNNSVAANLSSPRFRENEVHLLLSVLSFNLLSMLRGELEASSKNGWDLGRVQRSVLKTAVRITRGGRRLSVDLAMAAAVLWERICERIEAWRYPERWSKPRGPHKREWIPPPEHAHLSLVLRE